MSGAQRTEGRRTEDARAGAPGVDDVDAPAPSGEICWNQSGTLVLRESTKRRLIEEHEAATERRAAPQVEAACEPRPAIARTSRNERLAQLSHDLRTPLNAILGFGELLHDGHVDPASPEHREFLARILTNGRQLLAVIDRMLHESERDLGGR